MSKPATCERLIVDVRALIEGALGRIGRRYTEPSMVEWSTLIGRTAGIVRTIACTPDRPIPPRRARGGTLGSPGWKMGTGSWCRACCEHPAEPAGASWAE